MIKALIALLALAPSIAFAQQLAFPGADGYGRFATGGRGGDVYQVTNLLDSGAGSLRACVAASGPRTCVFRVAGTIELDTSLEIVNPGIYIAGQTAPGQGVALKNRNSLNAPIRVLASDVIIRHIRSRPGPSVSSSDNVDGARISGVGSIDTTENVTDIILDHVSLSWSTDESVDNSPWGDRITISDSFIYEGLHNATHPSGPHSKGPNLRGCGISIIRTLIANSVIRNPNNTCGMQTPGSPRGGGGVTGENEFRNNIVFNGQDGFLDFWNGRGSAEVNVVGNVFIRGPNTRQNAAAPYAVDARDFTSKYFDDGLQPGSPGYVPAGTSDPQALCLQDNISIGFPGDAGAPTSRAPEVFGVLDPRDANLVLSTNCAASPVGNPSAVGGVRGLTGPAMASSAVEAAILSESGALPWNRDASDARIASQVAARQGDIIDNPAEVGGWPALAGGTPYPDADADGMSDAFEAANGLNPNNAADRNGDLDGDGWTNLEEFLSELAGDQPGAPPLPTISVAVSPASAAEGTSPSSGATFTFTVTRSGDLSGASSVTFCETGSGANPANSLDFTQSLLCGGSIAFASGQSTAQRTKTTNSDASVESDEQMTFTLSAPVNASLGVSAATITVTNDDASPPVWYIRGQQTSVVEGNSGPTATYYKVGRDGDISQAATISFATAGKAHSGNPAATCADFPSGVCPSGVLSFSANEREKTLGVNVRGETTVESNEGFGVSISQPSIGAIGAESEALMTIINDDGGGSNGGFGVGASVETAGAAAVYQRLGAVRVGVQAPGARGVIIEGPAKYSGSTYWRVNFETGADGWVRQVSMRIA